MSLTMVVDAGTTNFKMGVIDYQGQILAKCSQTVDLKRPESGAVMHDPADLYLIFKELVAELGPDYKAAIKTIVFSGYQFGFMPMGVDDQPLTGMITLLDTRSKAVMPVLEEKLPFVKIYEKTGCPPLFTYILARLIWLKKYKPKIFAQSNWFADIKSFFINKLCGERVTEPSIAAVTQLYNLYNQKWDPELLDMAGITAKQLPRVVSGDKIVGKLNPDRARELGLGIDVSILPGVYDGGSMIIGMGGYENNFGICNLGTSGMLRVCSSQPLIDDPQKRRLQTYSLTEDKYAIGGGINNAGVTLRWYKNNLAGNDSYQEIIERAARVAPGAGGLFCFPFLTGERDPRVGNLASASFFGIKEHHDKGHLARSLLEGIGYTLNLIKEALQENGVTLKKIIIGGTASKDDPWCQILADIFNTPVTKALSGDSALVGGAIMAAKVAGKYGSIKEAGERMVKLGREFSPAQDNAEIYQKHYLFFKKMIANYQDFYRVHSRDFDG